MFSLRFFKPRFCENIRGGLADLFGPVQSSGDQNLTDFVLIFRFFSSKKCVCYSWSGFLLSGWLPGDPRPFPNERSLNSHILCGLNLLIGQDLTHFYLTQSLGMHLFNRSTISARCVMKESPPEKREGSFGSVLVTETIDPFSIDHFPSFRW